MVNLMAVYRSKGEHTGHHMAEEEQGLNPYMPQIQKSDTWSTFPILALIVHVHIVLITAMKLCSILPTIVLRLNLSACAHVEIFL